MNANVLWSHIIFPAPIDEEKWNLIVAYCKGLLANCDWTQLPDVLLTPLEKDAWVTYRETLQGIRFAFASPDDAVIPEAPILLMSETSAAVLAARARRKAARATAKAIPNWATWTQADWDAYFIAQLGTAQVNLVTSFPTVRIAMNRQNLVIQNLVKLVIAMRDHILSDLPD